MKLRQTKIRSQMILSSARRVGILLAAVLVLAGCSPEKPKPDRDQSPGVSGAGAWREKVSQVADLFELQALREEYLQQAIEPDREIIAALDARRDQLVKETDAFPAIPGALDFLGWKIQELGPDPDRRAGDDRKRYRISGYFVVTGKMDKNWTFRIMTKVDKQHLSYLPPDRRKPGYLNWQIPTETSTWQPGEHHILSTVMELRPIPYYIYARMYYYPEMINHANFAYGWFADPDVGEIDRNQAAT